MLHTCIWGVTNHPCVEWGDCQTAECESALSSATVLLNTHTQTHSEHSREKGQQTCTFTASHWWCSSATITLNNRTENTVGIISALCMWAHFVLWWLAVRALVQGGQVVEWIVVWDEKKERKKERIWNTGRMGTIWGAAVPLCQQGQNSQNHGEPKQTLMSVFACVSSESTAQRPLVGAPFLSFRIFFHLSLTLHSKYYC